MVDRDQEHLKKLIKRAKELQVEEEKYSLKKQRIEGQLLKFTNVVKGYQYRWCIVDPELGVVEYYEKKEDLKRSAKPRGTLNLTYASVCPSDEDSQAFVINAANGDLLKLKAANARDRQIWVDRIRAVAEYYTEKAEHRPMITSVESVQDEGSDGVQSLTSLSTLQNALHRNASSSSRNAAFRPDVGPTRNTPSSPDLFATEANGFPFFCQSGSNDPRAQLRELFRQLECETHALSNAVDATSIRSPELTAVYKTLLLSKATSQATLSCLKRCKDLIHQPENQQALSNSLDRSNTVDGRMEWGSTLVAPGSQHGSSGGDAVSESSRSSTEQWPGGGVFPSPILNMDSEVASLPDFPNDTETDIPMEEGELGSVENQKHVVLHLLSQLKFGMDLTKIVLPTFILEKRSLLEMFADYLAHPNLFINITRQENAEDRMLAFVYWYLTSFHAGRKDKVTKKPYNPIIGESFHCCWMVPPTTPSSPAESVGSASTSNAAEADNNTSVPDSTLITYCAEQVSHHPPVTGFRFHCPEQQMEINASLHTMSKFQGMSVSVSMLGKTILRLGQHNEEYHFNFPIAYARSILSIPWVELGDKVQISCPQTGYSALVVFHTKPMRSDKLHRVSAEVFAPSASSGSDSLTERTVPSGNMVARVSGVWNGLMEFEQFSKTPRKWSVNVNTLSVMRKLVRPIDLQRPEESRRLWQYVTSALHAGDVQLATEKKHELEERQRVSEKYRLRHRFPFPVKYFEWTGTTWEFRRDQPSEKPNIATTTLPVPISL